MLKQSNFLRYAEILYGLSAFYRKIHDIELTDLGSSARRGAGFPWGCP
jgi:hypothetical protein